MRSFKLVLDPQGEARRSDSLGAHHDREEHPHAPGAGAHVQEDVPGHRIWRGQFLKVCFRYQFILPKQSFFFTMNRRVRATLTTCGAWRWPAAPRATPSSPSPPGSSYITTSSRLLLDSFPITVFFILNRKIFLHLKCVLTVPGKQLPKWGYEQQEVTCNPTTRDPNAFWNVEDNYYPKCNY